MTREDAIDVLCGKVMEVVENNDWPTEEGHNFSGDEPCYIEKLVDICLNRSSRSLV